MGAKIKFTFKMDKHRGVVEPAARIWVDANRSETLEDDEELRVERDANTWTFTATKVLAANDTNGIAFRVTFVASSGDEWSLVVSSDKPEDHSVYKASGIVGHARETLVGRLAR
ncbi:hypothetical protein WMF11_11930 [Sorangium sp. So ce295]|jgi:hypothetical protein|uniref:hypothetical protein n=1 Tax=Sorangium sp. So ce295 TaxID=3133295 RepID=UPI003F60FACA